MISDLGGGSGADDGGGRRIVIVEGGTRGRRGRWSWWSVVVVARWEEVETVVCFLGKKWEEEGNGGRVVTSN